MGRSNVASISGLETAEGRLEPEADSDQNNNVQDFKTYDTKWRINIHLYTIIYYHLRAMLMFTQVCSIASIPIRSTHPCLFDSHLSTAMSADFC